MRIVGIEIMVAEREYELQIGSKTEVKWVVDSEKIDKIAHNLKVDPTSNNQMAKMLGIDNKTVKPMMEGKPVKSDTVITIFKYLCGFEKTFIGTKKQFRPEDQEDNSPKARTKRQGRQKILHDNSIHTAFDLAKEKESKSLWGGAIEGFEKAKETLRSYVLIELDVEPEPDVRRVFVSYSSSDQTLVRPIVQLFRAAGVTTFLDMDVPAGRRWRPIIEESLDKATLLMVFWCLHARDSVELRNQWLHAVERDKYIVPVLIDATPLEAPLAEYKAVDLCPFVRCHSSQTNRLNYAPDLEKLPKDIRDRLLQQLPETPKMSNADTVDVCAATKRLLFYLWSNDQF